MISLYKAVMDQGLRFQPCLHRFFKGVISSDMETLFFEANAGAEFSMAGIDTPEAAGIVAAVFPLFQPLYTGAVDPVQLIFDILLNFGFQTAAAPIIPVDQAILRYVQLIPAVTAAVPEDSAFPVPFIGGKQCGEPPNLFPGYIQVISGRQPAPAAAACCLSRFQLMSSYSNLLSAVAAAHPASPVTAVLCRVQHSKAAKPLSCEILFDRTSPRRGFGNTATVCNRPTLQPLCIHQNLPAAVTPAAPQAVSVLGFRHFFYYNQFPEPLARQVNGFRHPAPPFEQPLQTGHCLYGNCKWTESEADRRTLP